MAGKVRPLQRSSNLMTHVQKISRGERFAFGSNWAGFLHLLDDERIREAETSLENMLGVGTLTGKTFLDVGSGVVGFLAWQPGVWVRWCIPSIMTRSLLPVRRNSNDASFPMTRSGLWKKVRYSTATM